MDYLDFYELSQEPFSNAPVSRFYYDSAQHRQALLRLRYAVQSMKGRPASPSHVFHSTAARRARRT